MRRRVKKYRRKRKYTVRPEGIVKEKIIQIYDVNTVQRTVGVNRVHDAYFNIHHTRKGSQVQNSENAFFTDPITRGMADTEGVPSTGTYQTQFA